MRYIFVSDLETVAILSLQLMKQGITFEVREDDTQYRFSLRGY